MIALLGIIAAAIVGGIVGAIASITGLVGRRRDRRTEQIMRSVGYRVPMARVVCSSPGCRATNASKARWCWRCRVPFGFALDARSAP